jgi:tetratricopeptide (TPR) repeat protein
MQGLDVLYDYQGRTAQWARLVEQIRSHYGSAGEEPVPGLETEFRFVMGYRVHLAQRHERDLQKAARLQKVLVGQCRAQGAAALTLPADTPLGTGLINPTREYGVSLATLANILREDGDPACVSHFHEAIACFRRIGDTSNEASAECSLGLAYKDLSAVRDLDAAEVAYRRGLDLFAPNDSLNRSRTAQAIGMVYHERFDEARLRKESDEILLQYANAALQHYFDALRRCPNDALGVRAPMHSQLGNLFSTIGQLDNAREHYELAAQYHESTGDSFRAGRVRMNIAGMYVQAAGREKQPYQQRSSLVRSRAYAEAALRDFQRYQGRAAELEGKAQALLADIDEVLTNLPQ